MPLLTVQLAESSTVGPSKAEIWEFFAEKIVPIIRNWQLEMNTSLGDGEVGTSADSHETINKTLQTIIENLKEKNMAQVNWYTVCACSK